MAYNPRFPYSLKVLRAEMDDFGEPVFDADAKPKYSPVLFEVAEYKSNMPWRYATKGRENVYLLTSDYRFIKDADGKYLVAGQNEVDEYNVVARYRDTIPFGYRQQTANAVINGDVIIAEMKIACPLIIGEIKTKDLLEMTDDDRTFRAEVVKKINTNFGTNIWYNEVKQ